MEVKLVVVGGKNAGREIGVAGPKFFIGRSEDCHLRPGSDLVSRHHAVILVEDGFVSIRDFGSKNGTFVNDERVTTERELKTGDQLKIGPLAFEVQLTVDVGGKKKPKIHSVQEAAARTVETADDELDIGDWLEEPDASVTETRPGMVPAAQGSAGNETEISDIGLAQPRMKKKEKPDEETPNVVGQFKRDKGPTTESSGSAADDMLRQFFKRKQ